MADAAPPLSLVSVAGLVGRRARNAVGEVVGRVTDVVVRTGADAHPSVAGLLVRVGDRPTFVHIEQVVAIDKEVTLRSARVTLDGFTRRAGELLLVHDVLDHQVVDVDGIRVVRVADLYLTATDDGWRLVGMDAGTKPLLRRLASRRTAGAGQPDAVIDWAVIEPVAASARVLHVREHSAQLHRLRPADLADLLADLGHNERHALLARLEPARAADALEELSSQHVAALLRTMPVASAAALVHEMEPDEAVDALRRLPENVRRGLLDALPELSAERLDALLAFPAGTAGGLMTPRVVLARHDETVDAVRTRLAVEHPEGTDVDAVAVVDDGGRLIDDLPVFRMLVAAPDTSLGDLCDPHVDAVSPATPLAELLETFVHSRRTSVLVQDEKGRPIGRVLADDLLDAILPRPRPRVPGPRG